MKTKFTILFILSIITLSNAQQTKGELILGKGISLKWIVEKFIPEKHKIETCETDSKDKFICKIDEKLWLGSDQGMELPRNQLTKLALNINSNSIELDVSNIFNASYDGELSINQFLIKKEGSFYKLYSYFSDGAGTYTVHWKILNNTSIREVISNDESYFEWQNQKN